jgi:hypothetical protein
MDCLQAGLTSEDMETWCTCEMEEIMSVAATFAGDDESLELTNDKGDGGSTSTMQQGASSKTSSRDGQRHRRYHGQGYQEHASCDFQSESTGPDASHE